MRIYGFQISKKYELKQEEIVVKLNGNHYKRYKLLKCMGCNEDLAFRIAL